jgi:hypothetical protein
MGVPILDSCSLNQPRPPKKQYLDDSVCSQIQNMAMEQGSASITGS